ncbi:MAG TPA: PKD domain-containing protein [Vicinamibacterales bacterium]|nr:PKD domain-containing protein [Vicinamibacterales bacterium]
MSRKVCILVFLAVLLGQSPRPEALLLLDETSFGTAVHFNLIPATCCAGLPSVAIIQDGAGTSSDIQAGLDGSAQGQAVVAGVAVPKVGIQAITTARRSVGAIAATGAHVTGLQGSNPLIAGDITIEGTIVGWNHFVQLFVTDYLGHFLGALRISGKRLFTDPDTGLPLETPIDVEWFNWDYCPNPLAPNPNNLFCPQPYVSLYGVWGGEAILPFHFPGIPNNGVIVELHGDVYPFGQEERIDFLNTASVSFSPPPGVILTLATGQTFGAPVLPVANAGADQTRAEGTLVTLDGTGSSDPHGGTLSYSWAQVEGPAVVLSDPTSATPTFIAPFVDPGGATLLFELTATDTSGASATDQVAVLVQNVNDPPACAAARASQTWLWPPDHRLVPIAISGVSDPDNTPVAIAITGIAQDEPVDGQGDGDTSPDAANLGSTVLLRAERTGWGDGRVYHVYFTADDGGGGTCSGRVVVGVPHSARRPAIDDGPAYDSTRR